MQPFWEDYISTMDRFLPGLWREPERVSELDEEDVLEVLGYLVRLACLSEDPARQLLAFGAFQRMFPTWVLLRLPAVAGQSIDLKDSLHCRRLLDLYHELNDAWDSSMALEFAEQCTDSGQSSVCALGSNWMQGFFETQ